MKKLLITMTATLACLGVFAQGKLSFNNSADWPETYLIYFTTDTSKLVPADRNTIVEDYSLCGAFPIAGSSLYTGLTLDNTPGTIMSLSGSPTFIVGLYGGTSSSSLSLQTTTTIDDLNMDGNPGGIVPVNVTFNNLPAGTPAYFQVQVFDSRANPNAGGGGAVDAWAHMNLYAGVSQIFQATPSPSVYAPIVQTSSPVNSTWVPGTQEPVDLLCLGGGYYGAIEVYANASPPPPQGKLQFDNSDMAHAIYFTTNTSKLAPADQNAIVQGFPLAGSGLYTGDYAGAPGTIMSLSGSPTFVAALYGGTSSNSLSLQTTTTIGDFNLEGWVVPVNCTFASLPAGTPAWFQIQVFDSRANTNAAVINGVGGGAADAWAHQNWYAGASQVFQATPSAFIYYPIYQASAPVNSTWAPGTFSLTDWPVAEGGPAGAIEVHVNPRPPEVISQPTNATNYSGQGTNFSVTVSGNLPFTYQWQFNGINLSDSGHISGSATNTLALSTITLADAGTYRLIISNAFGGVTSAPIVLTVLAAPTITVQPQSQTNLVGSNVTFTVTVAAYPPVTYQWAFNGSNIAGATGASLLLTNIQLSQAGSYSVAATNSVGYRISTPAMLTVLSPPVLLSQPVSQVGYWGMNTSFGVDVAGTPPFSYQWYFYDFPISWGTNATLDLQDLDLETGGQYWVEVSNPYGSADSQVANLIVNPAGVFPGIYFGLTITGAVGKHFGIQYGNSVGGTTNWTTLTNVTLTQPVQIWVDTSVNVSTTPRRFYRVMAIPY